MPASNINRSFLINKLKLFLGEARSKEVFDSVVNSLGLENKEDYSREEMERIFQQMISRGEFVEFVARNARISFLVNK